MHPSTAAVLSYFDRINAIPRCSKNEGRLHQWLKDWAHGKGFETKADAVGNLVVRIPASAGCENAPIVVIQGHMDMVCEKTTDSDHDFTKDPIVAHTEGDWLTADRTTLGADNGIAIAYALALVENAGVKHPPLELLFTVDEETGLNGVKAMAADLIDGRRLINLDSEDEGVFTIGCAGGVDTTLKARFEMGPIDQHTAWTTITIGGLTGGHSGIDIHKQRASANKLIGRALDHIRKRVPCRLVTLTGGTRHNAIARDAAAAVTCSLAEQAMVYQAVSDLEQIVKGEYGRLEPDLFIRAQSESPSGGEALTIDDTQHIIDVLQALPHGVAGMSQTVDGVVETSSNLATVKLADGGLTVLSSQRSSIASRLDELTDRIHAISRIAGIDAQNTSAYPPWRPKMNAMLLHDAQAVYRRLYDREPVIQVIHAGLECAIIGDLYSGIEMISFGPTIENPHSPSERLNVPSVQKVWRFLAALLSSLAGRDST